MSWKKTGNMVQPPPHEEQHQVCDECGKVLCVGNESSPTWSLDYDPDIPYDDGSLALHYHFCTVGCVAQWAQKNAGVLLENIV